MKFFIVLAVFVAAAAAAPADKDAEVVYLESTNIGTGDYVARSKTSNGIETAVEGVLANVGQENAAVIVKGSYSYVGADGKQYSLSYIADQNGFQPSADYLPRSP